jgi:hypothetical protein
MQVILDVAEPRIARDRITALVDGRHWDTLKSTCYVDGITRTAMLMPLYLTPAWSTTTTGLYRRFGNADYTFETPPFVAEGTPPPYPDGTPTDPSKWVEDPVPYAGNIYLTAQGVNDRARTNLKFSKNQPFLLSWFSYNAGQSSLVQIECGWLSEDGMVALRIWTDGKCEIFKNGVQVGEGNIYERHVTTQTIYGKERFSSNLRPKQSSGDAKQLASQFVDLMLIPCRRRDLLVISNQGGGFRFTFEDIDANDPDPVITPKDARFFWQVPVGQPKVLLAPLNFATSGDLYSAIRTSRLAPEEGETPEMDVYLDLPGYDNDPLGWNSGLVDPDLSGAFVPDGSKNQVRVHVSLTGGGTSTLFVYGASATFDPQIELTDSANQTDISSYITTSELSVPESPTDVRMRVECHSPVELGTSVDEGGAGAIGVTEITNRPVAAQFGSGADAVMFLTGRSKPAGSRFGISDPASRVMLEFRDRCEALEEYGITDALPFDGMELADAFTSLVVMPGYDESDVEIDDFGFPCPTVGQTSGGEWALIPEVGDRPIEWIKKLWETFAQHCLWGWWPTALGPKFRVPTLDSLNAAPSKVTLYAGTGDAINAGVSRSDAPFAVYRTLEPVTIPCEANDIWVTGRDPRTGLPFQVHYADKRSQDPTLAPGDRPNNWVGEPRKYAFARPWITDPDTANWVCGTLARRLTVRRRTYPISCELQFGDDGVPIWRGDKITLDGIGDVRVTTLHKTPGTEFADDESDRSLIWRPASYTGELVEPGI